MTIPHDYDGIPDEPTDADAAMRLLEELVAAVTIAQDVVKARALLDETRANPDTMRLLGAAWRVPVHWNHLNRTLGKLRNVRGLAEDRRDFERAIAAEAKSQGEGEDEARTTVQSDGRQIVRITPDLHVMVRQSVAALASEDTIYTRNQEIVHTPTGDRLRQVGPQHMRVLLSRTSIYVQTTQSGDVQQAPPWDVATAILEAGYWPGLRPIEAIVRTPVLRADGSILQTPGYDPASRLLYVPDFEYAAVPDRPTLADAQEAIGRLFALVADFPFESASDWSAWLALTLTPFARYAIAGNVPLFLVEASTPGTGKSLLAKVAGAIAYGEVLAPLKPFEDEAELGKTITGYVREGKAYAFMDNVAGRFGWATLDQALTSEGRWESRILGGNEMYCGRSWLIWIASGNNAQVVGDTSRRTQRIRMRTDEEHPESRTEFRIPQLIAHVLARRPELVIDCLTILRAFMLSGAHPDIRAWGSFERWSEVVRGAIVWAGYVDPIESHLAMAATVDTQGAALARMLEAWPFVGAVTVSDVRQKAAALDPGHDFREALCELVPSRDGGVPGSQSIGNRFSALRDRLANGRALRLEVDENGKPRRRHSAALWTVWVPKPSSDER